MPPEKGASLFALYNMESLVNKFANKYICFYTLFMSGGLKTKDNYVRGPWQKKG